MQIPDIPFLSGPGFLREPQPGTRQQVNTELQVKAQANPAPEGTRPAGPTARAAAGRDAAGLSSANSLDEAVRSLAADGRLPRRGSLIDLKA